MLIDIRIDPHTLERAIERGANEDEIIDVIATGFDISAKRYRKGKAKVYSYNKKRLNRFYE